MYSDEAEDPAAVPMVWVSKWVDYSDKYGFGYQLSDDTIGVIFNDLTKLLLLVDGKYVAFPQPFQIRTFDNIILMVLGRSSMSKETVWSSIIRWINIQAP